MSSRPPMTHQKRILVIEDNPDLAYGLRNNLDIEGYEVEVAKDGARGVAAAVGRRRVRSVDAEEVRPAAGLEPARRGMHHPCRAAGRSLGLQRRGDEPDGGPARRGAAPQAGARSRQPQA